MHTECQWSLWYSTLWYMVWIQNYMEVMIQELETWTERNGDLEGELEYFQFFLSKNRLFQESIVWISMVEKEGQDWKHMFQVVMRFPSMLTSLSFVRNDQCPCPKHMFVVIVFVYIPLSLFRVFCHQLILVSIWWMRRRGREEREEEKNRKKRKEKNEERRSVNDHHELIFFLFHLSPRVNSLATSSPSRWWREK